MRMRHMWRIARFELALVIQSPVFWIVAAIFALLGFSGLAFENLSFGTGGNVHKNAPLAIVIGQARFVQFFQLAMVAFVAGAVVRDDETRFGPILRSTQIAKPDYIYGRFLGGFLAVALLYIAVPLGMLIGSFMPWIDPQRLGPTMVTPYLYGYFIGALPSIFAVSAIIFALATALRSMMASYLGGVALFILYIAYQLFIGNDPSWRFLAAYFNPYATGTVAVATQYWTPEESNSLVPPVLGSILWHQLLWIVIGCVLLWLSCVRYSFADRVPRRWPWARATKAESPAPDVSALPRNPPASSAFARGWAQLWAQASLETSMTLRSTGFIVLLILAVFLTALVMYLTPQIFGAPRLPITRLVIGQISGGFTLFQLIVAAFYAGEIVFRERAVRLDGIIDATPLPNWGYLFPKTIALFAVLVAMSLAAALVGIAHQLISGFYDIELTKYLMWYVIPSVVDDAFLAVIAIVLQALSPNKFIGWGLFVVYIVVLLSASLLGIEDHLFLYGSAPSAPLSDLNADGVPTGDIWFWLYWGCIAVVLMLVAFLMWPRGTGVSYRTRLAAMPRRLKGATGLLGAAAVLGAVGFGGFIYYNTHMLNHFRTSEARIAAIARYEKTLIGYAKVPQPAVAHVAVAVDLYPSQLRMAAHGTLTLKNLTDKPLNEVDVGFREPDSPGSVTVEGAHRTRYFDAFKFSVFQFDKPMLPGETRLLHFTNARAQHGFANEGNDTQLVYNGTFLSNANIAPTLGISKLGLLHDKAKRRKYGLPEEVHVAKLEDRSGQARPLFPSDWTTADFTVSTDADQIPIAPGKKVSDVTKDGRRTARFVSTAPILNFYSIQSARYDVAERAYPGIKLQVYYHPGNPWNVDRMLSAMTHAFDYYQANFGPYQFDQMRIVEFPAYEQFAQSFANTIPFSEDIGFTTDVRNPAKIDMVTYVTAHEVAHQYWAHQIMGADMQGATMLVETFSQYSALMVMKHLYGPDKMRRFLAFERNNYLVQRKLDPVEELPLERVENQQYLHYNKGSLVMYLLAEKLGEDRVNAALRQVLNRYKFKGAPYPRSLDFIDALRAQARTPAEQQLITDLFERITVYRFRTRDAHADKRPDGRWTVRFTVEAQKFDVTGKGKQTTQHFNEAIPVGAFAAKPDADDFGRKDVLSYGTTPIHDGTQLVTLTTPTKPRFVGVDPYVFYITRNAEDNLLGL